MAFKNKEDKKAYQAKWFQRNKVRMRELHKKYREENKDSLKASAKIWRDKNPEKVKNYGIKHRKSRKWKDNWLRKTYGITIDEYDRIYELQDGRCAICGIQQYDIGKPLSVDHDHVTGAIRGLLCKKCNLVLGWAGDSIDILNNSIRYLVFHQSQSEGVVKV